MEAAISGTIALAWLSVYTGITRTGYAVSSDIQHFMELSPVQG